MGFLRNVRAKYQMSITFNAWCCQKVTPPDIKRVNIKLAFPQG